MPPTPRLSIRVHTRQPRGHRLRSPRSSRCRCSDACAKRCDDLVAGMILNTISQRGFSVRVRRQIAGANAGWIITAQHRHTSEYWCVRADAPLDAVCALIDVLGLRAQPAVDCAKN